MEVGRSLFQLRRGRVSSGAPASALRVVGGVDKVPDAYAADNPYPFAGANPRCAIRMALPCNSRRTPEVVGEQS